nr:hypothetical protein [Tanacetum cinerariifolium]
MHRRNEGISSSSASLSEGSSRVPQCLSEEYEDHLRRSHEDFQPLPRIFTKTIFTHEELGALYRRYRLKANQTPIRMDKSDAWRSVAQDLELSAAKEAVKAMQNLQAIIQCKAQICFGQSTKDNHWDWDATTSNFSEDDTSNDDNKYRYNRKGFLEDDDSRSDDLIFIVNPGWDDYCLQALKLNLSCIEFKPLKKTSSVRGSSASFGTTFLFIEHADAPVSIIAVVPNAEQSGMSNSTFTL